MKKYAIVLVTIILLLLTAGSALASATPTPTPAPQIGMDTFEPTPTPEPFGPSIGWPGGGNGSGGNRPGGDGQGPGSGGQGDPKQPPPPTPQKKEAPPGEENTPWEIEPDDSGQPVKPKRAKLKKMVGTYTLKVNETKQALLIDGKSAHDFTLNLTATKTGGGMSGNYIVSGTLSQELVRFEDEYNVSFEYAGSGALSGTLVFVGPNERPPIPAPPPDDELAPLVPKNPESALPDDDELAPLKRTQLRGAGSVYWAAATTQNRFIGIDGYVGPGGDWYPENVGIEVTVYEDGSAIVKLSVPGIHSLYYKGRFVKHAALVDVK